MPPVIAPIVAAAGAIKGAVAAAGIMKSMAVAGTALSVVGTATGNQKLAKIGAVVGTVGTLGTVGAFGSKAATLGMSESAKTAAATKAATSYGANIRPNLTRQALQSGAPAQQLNQLAPGAGVRSLAAGGGQMTPGAGLLRNALPAGLPAPTLSATQAAPTVMGRIGGALKAAGNVIKDNPELATVMAAGAGELANFLSGKTDAEIREMESRIDANDANAQQALFAIAEEKRRRQNLNQGYMAVNPTITSANPYQPPGLLAQSMPGAPR